MAESILRLKVASEEYENKLKRASEGLQKYIEGCRKAGGTLEHLDDGVLDFVKALGSMETKSTSARGKISELRKGFIEMKAEYLHMTEAEKNGDIGKALSASLDQLKTRFHDAKNELAEITKELNGGGGKFGEFGNVLDTLGSKLGVTGNLTDMLTSKTALLTGAVGAGIAVVTKSAEAWASYNAELAKQDQVTQVTTGLKGEDADRMTDKMRALSDTYKVDFREAVNAANTLMTQFGVTGDQATQLIKDGMRGMIQGDGPKLLSMIQQYAPAFRDAGISASQLVAVIQNSEGGIFTDQNMNAIVMGIKNIRLMTKATSDSLAQLGINGEEMTKKLNNGSITIFDALRQVVGQLKNAEAGSKTAGEVMQNVFGRQGVTAGTNLAKAIETLNTDLEKTKVQTGEVGDAMAELQQANEDLNQAIRDAFSYDGWDQMANGIKAKLITALATVIEQLGKIRNFFDSFSPGNVTNTSEVEKQLKKLRSAKTSGSTYYTNFAYNDQVEKYNRNINGLDAYIKQYDQNHSSVNTVIQKASKEYGQKFSSIEDLRDLRNAYSQSLEDYKKGALSILSEPTKTTNTSNTNHHRTGGNTTTTKTEDTNYAADSIMAQEKLVSDLTQKWKTASGEMREGYLKDLEEAQKKLAEMTGKSKGDGAPTFTMSQLEGMSFDNQMPIIRGNEGKAQDKLDLATAAFATGGTSNIDFSNYTAALQNAIKDANIGSELYAQLSEQLSDSSQVSQLLQQYVANGITGADLGQTAQELKDKLMNGEINDNVIQQYVDELNAKLMEKFDETEWPNVLITFDADTKNIVNAAKQQEKDAQKMAKNWQSAGSAIQAVGAAMSQIEDPAAKVMGTIAQAIATIALTFASSLKGTFTPWDWIAAAAAGTATMISTIAAIHSATGYAEGGMIKGNSYSGDNIGGLVDGSQLVGLNAGEVVLNRAQQGNLASQLEGGGGPREMQPYIDGEYLYLGLQAYMRRSGMGEIVTSNR